MRQLVDDFLVIIQQTGAGKIEPSQLVFSFQQNFQLLFGHGLTGRQRDVEKVVVGSNAANGVSLCFQCLQSI